VIRSLRNRFRYLCRTISSRKSALRMESDDLRLGHWLQSQSAFLEDPSL